MKYLYHSLKIVLLVIVMMACKKLANDSLDDVPVSKATLGITVINDEDQQPVVGAKVIISRKVSADGDFARIDTVRTNEQGQIAYEIPYPNYLKVEIDTTYYHKDMQELEFFTKDGGAVTLHTTPKFGMAPLEINVTDKDGVPLPDFALAVGTRAPGQIGYTSTGTENTDASGKLILSLPYPNEVKVAVGDTIKYAPDSVTANLTNKMGAAVVLKAELKSFYLNVYTAVYGENNPRKAFGVNVKVSYRVKGQTAFTELSTNVIDDEGKLKVSIPLAEEMKFEVINDQVFLDKTITVSNDEIPERNVDIPLTVRPPKYPEPVLTNLQVSTLEFNNDLSVNKPQDIVTDKLGNRYITEGSGNRILRVDRSGNTMVLAGTGTAGYKDGDGTEAQLNGPWGITIDKEGNLYTTDNANVTGSHRIRKITINAIYKATVSTIAGSGTADDIDGVGTAATFKRPSGICYDEQRNCLYVVEWGGNKLRKVDLSNNQVTTLAGAGQTVTEGVGAAGQFQIPWGVKLSADGNYLYVSSWNGNALSKVRLSDNNVTILGKGKSNMSSPRGLYVSPANKVFLANTGGNYISMMSTEAEGNASVFTRVTSSATKGYKDGSASVAQFGGPVGICYDPYTGIWYIADGDGSNQKVRMMKSDDIH